MGTNFYWKLDLPQIDDVTVQLPTGEKMVMEAVWMRKDDDDDGSCPSDPEKYRLHIGKRSAAGLYCWDCRQTFCQEGEKRIHSSSNRWFDTCPSCGKGPPEGNLKESAVGIELGFCAPKKERPTGVRTCSSFSWAKEPQVVRQACKLSLDIQTIEDEYGHTLTGQEFLEMLECNCPIEYTSMIGEHFS